MGFCLYNNIAVGAAHGLHAHGLKRVAIVDFDVHHGNGTDDIFLHEPRVLFCSTFQHPFYPHEGAEARDGAPRVNVPLPAGTRGEGFRAAVREQWLPALDAFRPQLLLISAGFDGHLEDDMAGLGLVEADYEWVTRELRASPGATPKDASCRHWRGLCPVRPRSQRGGAPQSVAL
jgi:acetoin utilization deacetylase AcuC-like enzyme